MNDIINYVMETPQNTNPAILRQKVEEYAAKNGAGIVAKPVFFVSTTSADYNNYHVMAYYDNPDKLATVEEVVDAYMTGAAYFIVNDSGHSPNKIVGFGISESGPGGEVTPKFIQTDSSINNFIRVGGSKKEDLIAAMAKYLP